MQEDAKRHDRSPRPEMPSRAMQLGDPHDWPVPVWTQANGSILDEMPIAVPYRGVHRLDCADGTRYHVEVDIVQAGSGLQCTMTLVNRQTAEQRQFGYTQHGATPRGLLDYAIAQLLREVCPGE